MEHESESSDELASTGPAAAGLASQDPASPAQADAGQEEAEGGDGQTSTGEPRVDAAVGRLSELAGLPVSEHPAVFERIHGQLVDVLGELHYGPEAPEPPGPASGA